MHIRSCVYLPLNHPDDDCLIDVYNLTSNSWRRVTTTDLAPINSWDGIFFNGSYYWSTKWPNESTSFEGLIAIASFDMILEKVREMKYPCTGAFDFGYSCFAVIGGSYAPLNLFSKDIVSIYGVMTEYGVNSSWMKKCTVGPFDRNLAMQDIVLDIMACWNAAEKLLIARFNLWGSGTRYAELISCDVLEAKPEMAQQVKRYGIFGYEMRAVVYKESLVQLRQT